MAGEMVAFRRAALGSPVADYARLVDRARVNSGGRGTANGASADTSNSSVTKAVVASATPHSVGLYTELIASTAARSETLVVIVTSGPTAASANSATLMNIAFGADGAEVVKIANLNIGFGAGGRLQFIIPFAIPAGTRISANIQSVVVSQSVSVAAWVRQSGDHSAAPTVCTTIGADVATSNGAIPTVAGTANTKSSWTELEDSTTAAYSRMLVTVGGTSVATMVAGGGLIDIGVGPNPTEAAIAENIFFETFTTELVNTFGASLPFTVAIALAARIVWRYQSTSTNTAARPTVCIHLFN